MLSISSKPPAIIKVLVRGPLSKYLRGPHICVDHSLDSQWVSAELSLNYDILIILGITEIYPYFLKLEKKVDFKTHKNKYNFFHSWNGSSSNCSLSKNNIELYNIAW